MASCAEVAPHHVHEDGREVAEPLDHRRIGDGPGPESRVGREDLADPVLEEVDPLGARVLVDEVHPPAHHPRVLHVPGGRVHRDDAGDRLDPGLERRAALRGDREARARRVLEVHDELVPVLLRHELAPEPAPDREAAEEEQRRGGERQDRVPQDRRRACARRAGHRARTRPGSAPATAPSRVPLAGGAGAGEPRREHRVERERDEERDRGPRR